ncbi:hypothetical protein FRACA_3540004 [Frankia canadensis]|uniref:Leucine-binding protein domain-containing protein n=1 Tax=Frankia canadensis TaxID=1836972 RepID=A0A2I2KVE1_9ACTN|nr:ABC transporter substrate-binding protein [Frankia canadensis]SNQ49625.1 hypothetical protein FRACA_3540004 [Frankia canadensis]SOU56915.1 hypothetical protein FRACA_3540004 [Frankia canadensis]
MKDDQYNPTNTATLTRQLVLRDNVLAVFASVGTATSQAVQPFLNSRKVPQLFVTSGCTCFYEPAKNPWSVGWLPPLRAEGEALATYVKQTYPTAKVGYLSQADSYGMGGVQGADQVLDRARVVSRQTYSVSSLPSGLGNQVAALKAAGASVVMLTSIAAGTAAALLAADQIGYHPTWVVSTGGSSPSGLTPLLAKAPGGAAAHLRGVVTETFMPAAGETTSPWNAFFTSILAKYGHGVALTTVTEQAMAQAVMMVDLLDAAGPHPTRENLISTLTAKANSFVGPWLSPPRYSATDYSGLTGMRIAVNDGHNLFGTGPIYTVDAAGRVTQRPYQAPAPPSG